MRSSKKDVTYMKNLIIYSQKNESIEKSYNPDKIESFECLKNAIQFDLLKILAL